MIELIFAIVIIAITVAAVPQMITRNDRTLTGSLVRQELFYAAKTASELLTQPWDTNSPDTSTSKAYDKVLDITGSAAKFARVSSGGITLPFRQGHIRQDNHRRFHGTATAPAGGAIPGSTSSPTLPADDTLSINSNYTGETDTTVFASAPSATAANMKMATITVTNTNDANRSVTLRVYAANIGEVTYAKRSF
jgi:hypothetical protein